MLKGWEYMKKLLSVILALILLMLAASACSAEPAANDSGDIEIPVITEMKRFEIPDNEALRFVRELKTGWNLGNTFDANNPGTWFHGSELEIESMWCGVKTSKELIQAIKAAGFNLIRIPVSWHDHVDENDNISTAWMNRVKLVVRWCVNEGLYVIVNVHHDNQKGFLYPSPAYQERSKQYMQAVWKQMAEAFADFDDHVILESMNEPRMVDTAYEWTWNQMDADCRNSMRCINELNQLFVDTVRATGGNNATRYLLVPSYDASPYYAVNEMFELPQDTADNRIIVEAHAYTPYDFALNSNGYNTFDHTNAKYTTEIATIMNSLYNRYVSNGIPVLIDEYGAMNKRNNLQDRVNFAAYFVASASARGITCCWWDNHGFSGSGELFGLIDRRTYEWKYPEIVEAIMKNCLYNREE